MSVLEDNVNERLTRDALLNIKEAKDSVGLHSVPNKSSDKETITNAIQAVLNALQKLGHREEHATLTMAAGNHPLQLAILRKSIPKTPWKGKWDVRNAEYVGTGDYEGMERPQDHAPRWWQQDRMIPPQKYVLCYEEASYFEDIQEEFWFASESHIKAAHDVVNEWCDRNKFKRLRKKPARKATFSQSFTAGRVKTGTFKKL